MGARSPLADRGGGTPAVCNFFRFNRAQLINTVHIAPLEPWFSQTLEAKLRDGKAVEFGRRASLLFRETRGL
ncbi:MAG: LytTR family transcriptional regulator DNA-binding domain-containing protein [Roseimicrobium sp.]